MRKNKQPSKLATGFLRWFCAPHLIEEIEGDLCELYNERLEEYGKTKANWAYAVDIIKLFRPFAFKICYEPQMMYTMETKKNPTVDLGNKYNLFLSAGLLISLVLITMAFEWKSYDDQVRVDLPTDLTVDQTLYLPPSTVQPPPVKEIKIIPVDNDEDIKTELSVTIDLSNIQINQEPTFVYVAPPDEVPDELPFYAIEEQPYFEGGMKAFYQYIGKNLNYPRLAVRNRVEGKVFVSFIIDTDGSITDVEILKGIGAGCDEEAIKVLKNAPRWYPGKQRGKAVRVRMRIPVIFQLR